MKLEHAKGIRGSRRSRDGRTRFDVKRVADLLFTDRANVYKLCVATVPDGDNDGGDRGSVTGHAADPQTAGRRLADFFLGCRYAHAPDVLTQRFHDGTADWINSEAVPDPARRVRYAVALLAEMNSPRPDMSVREFARTHLETEDRDAYRDAMAASGVPVAAFPKDASLVGRRASVQFRIES